MKYALWKLSFNNSDQGTGPEDLIISLGGQVESSYSNGSTEDGNFILGYVTGNVLEEDLAEWEFKYISQSEALDFVLSFNDSAYLLDDGKIAVEFDEMFI